MHPNTLFFTRFGWLRVSGGGNVIVKIIINQRGCGRQVKGSVDAKDEDEVEDVSQ